MPMPTQKPGRSKQDYETPEVFLHAVRKKLGIRNFTRDLAATEANCVTRHFYSPEQDSLTQPWDSGNGWAWLNPPFANIDQWVAKAAEAKSRGQRIVVLIPASVGADWWKAHVHNVAQVWCLNGRITFGGTPVNPKTGKVDAYPKDCALLIYAPEYPPLYTIWSWQ